MSILAAEGLTKRFGKNTALQNFDINIPEGSIYGLLGPNGAGKTTFLRMVNQITAPDSGIIEFRGEKLAPKHIRYVGYMPEERGLYKNMKVGEQAMYFAKIKGLNNKEAKERAQFWFEKLNMTDWWSKKLNELSKGMGQKVQFVITVIHEPSLLIFDEPFSGFDPVNAKLIGQEILELRQKGTTIIFSTHRMESVEEMCDHVALINKSKKVLDGPVDKVRDEYKKGRYVLKLKDNGGLQTDYENFKVIEKNTASDLVEAKIVLKNDTTANEALQRIMTLGEVVRFEEDIPSMNEIFLRAVEHHS